MKWSKQKAQDLQTLIAGGSTIKDACGKIGIDRTTFYLWKELHPEWAANVQQVRETLLDDVEDAIFTKAKAGDVTACIFILKTQGRKRGWIEKQEINLNGSLNIEGAEALTPAEEAALKAIAFANK